MSCLPGGLGCVSERVGVHRHAVAACIVGLVVLLAGCSNSAEPYLVQVDCAKVMASEDMPKQPNEQAVVLWYSDGTSRLERRDGTCLQLGKVWQTP